jgi:pyruvate/2-oxoglutarate dehydrogenase complex dihydrolipoamide dehydrogenase (E3) component
MYKLAAVTTVVAAGAMDQFRETAETFTIRINKKEIEDLEKHADMVDNKEDAYTKMMRKNHHMEVFKDEVKAIKVPRSS